MALPRPDRAFSALMAKFATAFASSIDLSASSRMPPAIADGLAGGDELCKPLDRPVERLVDERQES